MHVDGCGNRHVPQILAQRRGNVLLVSEDSVLMPTRNSIPDVSGWQSFTPVAHNDGHAEPINFRPKRCKTAKPAGSRREGPNDNDRSVLRPCPNPQWTASDRDSTSHSENLAARARGFPAPLTPLLYQGMKTLRL